MDAFPAFGGLLDRQEKRLQRRFVIGENPPVAGEFSHAHVQRFNGVCRVDHLADFRHELEKRDDIVPIAAPRPHHRFGLR